MRVMVLLLLLAILYILAQVSGFELLTRLSYVVAISLVLSFLWAWLNIRWLRVEVHREGDRAQVGDWVGGHLTVHNGGPLTKVWLEVQDSSTMPDYHVGQVVHLNGGRETSWRFQAQCRQRGRFTLGPVTAMGGDPLGMFVMRRTLSTTNHLLVYPATVELPRFSLPLAQLPGEGRYRRRSHHITPNVSSVRDYQWGDSLNRIHWPTTARQGKLMVKEFEQDPASETWLVLDMEGTVQVGRGPESTEEYAVTAAASVAKKTLLANRGIGLIMAGETYYTLPPERGMPHLWRILEELAVVRAVGTLSLSEILTGEGKRFGRHTALVVVTASIQEGWTVALRNLTRRGVRAAVVLVEPSTFGGEANALLAVGSLAADDIPVYLVKQGESLGEALNSPANGAAKALKRGGR